MKNMHQKVLLIKKKKQINEHKRNIEKAIDIVFKKSENKKMFIKSKSTMLQNVKKRRFVTIFKQKQKLYTQTKFPKRNARKK